MQEIQQKIGEIVESVVDSAAEKIEKARDSFSGLDAVEAVAGVGEVVAGVLDVVGDLSS